MSEITTPPIQSNEMLERPFGRFFIPKIQKSPSPWDTYLMTTAFTDEHQSIIRRPLVLVSNLALHRSGELTQLNHSVPKSDYQRVWLALDVKDYSKHWLGWQLRIGSFALTLYASSMANRYATSQMVERNRNSEPVHLDDTNAQFVHRIVQSIISHEFTRTQLSELHSWSTSPDLQDELTKLREAQMYRTLTAEQTMRYMALRESASLPSPPWK